VSLRLRVCKTRTASLHPQYNRIVGQVKNIEEYLMKVVSTHQRVQEIDYILVKDEVLRN
jgi:type VI protein secretion system component VasF